MRGHRSVVLPDYQGIGIGNAMITTLASMWVASGYRVFRNTGHPAEIAGALRDPSWRLTRTPSMRAPDAGGKIKHATNRMTASFEFSGAPFADAALAARIVVLVHPETTRSGRGWKVLMSDGAWRNFNFIYDALQTDLNFSGDTRLYSLLVEWVKEGRIERRHARQHAALAYEAGVSDSVEFISRVHRIGDD